MLYAVVSPRTVAPPPFSVASGVGGTVRHAIEHNRVEMEYRSEAGAEPMKGAQRP